MDFLQTLKLLTAKLKDGHAIVLYAGTRYPYRTLLDWDWIEGQLVVTQVADSALPCKAGDIITHVNGKEAGEYYIAFRKYISAATEGFLLYRIWIESVMGPVDSSIHVTVRRADQSIATANLKRWTSFADYLQKIPRPDTIKQIAASIIYINFSLASMAKIENAFPALKKAKVIICDLRGYPKNNHQFIQHLLKRNDTSKQWMQIPQITYPDQENIAGYKKIGWELKQLKPHLKAKIIFLTDGKCVS